MSYYSLDITIASLNISWGIFTFFAVRSFEIPSTLTDMRPNGVNTTPIIRTATQNAFVDIFKVNVKWLKIDIK